MAAATKHLMNRQQRNALYADVRVLRGWRSGFSTVQALTVSGTCTTGGITGTHAQDVSRQRGMGSSGSGGGSFSTFQPSTVSGTCGDDVVAQP
jgi:hypothetical protein